MAFLCLLEIANFIIHGRLMSICTISYYVYNVFKYDT